MDDSLVRLVHTKQGQLVASWILDIQRTHTRDFEEERSTQW